MRVSTGSSLSSMVNCMMQIEVTNMSPQSTTRSGAYIMKVPFSSLSRTMQFIHRSGGKVVEVTKLSAATALADLPPVPTAVYASTVRVPAPSAATTPVAQQSEQDRSKRGSKRK
jgi:CpcD/allophycocyanin linker domain